MNNRDREIIARLHVIKDDILIVRITDFDKNNICENISVEVDKSKLELLDSQTLFDGTPLESEESVRNYKKEILLNFKLPENWKEFENIRIYGYVRYKEACLYELSTSTLKKQIGALKYSIDKIEKNRDRIFVSGWYISEDSADINLYSELNNKIEFAFQADGRMDVIRVYPEVLSDNIRGFNMSFENPNTKKVIIRFEYQEKNYGGEISLIPTIKSRKDNFLRILRQTKRDYKRYGLINALIKSRDQSRGIIQNPYEKWREKNHPNKEALQNQREKAFEYSPLISIVIPLFNTPFNYLSELVESVKQQTYSNWEICFSDGGGEKSTLTESLKRLVECDRRIRFVAGTEKLQISENTNRALGIAGGDWVVFSDHDDLLTPDALFECVRVINENPDIEMIYTDEDKVSMDGKTYFEPAFKPDFNMDLLNSANYICHLCIVKKELLNKVGGLNGEFDGAQDFDFVLRCAEHTDKIYHIPKVLYHWRSHLDSTAGNPVSKVYAFKAGTRAIAAHLIRTGLDSICNAEETTYLGISRIRYKIQNSPLVSIIIYCSNDSEKIDDCISSLNLQSYGRLQIILCSRDENIIKQYRFDKVVSECSNIAELYNNAASKAKGEYILFTNDGMLFSDRECIEELIGPCQRDDIAAVGGRWRFNNEYLSHAGMIVGINGCAARLYENSPYGNVGYLGRIVTQQNYSAVSLDALMTDSKVFKELEGFDTGYSSDLCGVDWCIKSGIKGYKIYYNPYAQAVDHSLHEKYPEKDKKLFVQKWKDLLDTGDPFYNPNLSLSDNNFELKR